VRKIVESEVALVGGPAVIETVEIEGEGEEVGVMGDDVMLTRVWGPAAM